jgi:pimeloyl-ACP methyl ester carboxylesterase
MVEAFKDRFFYQLYFQEPGVAEADLERDIAVSLRKFLFAISGDGNLAEFARKQAGDDLLSSLTDPGVMPAWLSPEDLSYYAREFERSGFRGPLNYYRNHNLTWELTSEAPDKILQPAMFVAGDKDGVVLMAAEALKQMPVNVPDLKINELIPGIGHWTQQEAPDAVNDAILRFLAALPESCE